MNCWGIPYAGTATRARLVLPGKRMDGAGPFELIRDEGMILTRAVVAASRFAMTIEDVCRPMCSFVRAAPVRDPQGGRFHSR